MAARGLFGLISLILVAGGLLLGLFIILAGAIDHSPVNKWYFLQADTSNIPNAPALSRWTFWDVVDGSGGNDASGNVSPAFPLDPPRNFGTSTNVPPAFVGTSYYYLMTRSMFAFALISLFFGACALATGVLALCTRLGAYLSGFLTMLAFLFQAIMAGLMTAAYVKGRDHFRSNGQASQIGETAFGFEWASFACYFLATIFFCIGGRGKKDNYKSSGGPAKGSFFKGGRTTSTRSRGSFINGDKEYE